MSFSVGRLARSMIVQTMLLSLVFLAAGVYVLAVRPVLEQADAGGRDPRDVTVSMARTVIAHALSSQPAPAEAARLIARDPFIRAVARRNPGFRYAAILGDARIGTGEPVHYHRLGLDRIGAAKALADPALCLRIERLLRLRDGRGAVSYDDCPEPRYYEFGGIRHAVAIDDAGGIAAHAAVIWRGSRSFVLPALGMLLLCASILAINIVLIRRTARLIQPPEEDGPIRPLPEHGLPDEVLPLVRGVNGMIAEVTRVEAGQRFFLSAAAHEMRTPLTVLRTRLEMLEEGEAKSKLVSDVRRLTRLVNELLTLMSVRSRSVASGEVDLARCCRRVVAALDSVAAARGVRLDLAMHPDVPRIAGDPALVEVAVTNLVDNAIGFSPNGAAVTITVDAAAVLTVRDRGKGIPAEQARTLFEPFVRYSRSPGGYGLGLTIVKAVAELHGASVNAANAPGGGATFSMHFAMP